MEKSDKKVAKFVEKHIINKMHESILKNLKMKRGKTMLNKLKWILNKNRCCQETQINPQQLEKMVEKGAILIDVRSPQEFQEGHLEKAILLPEYELRQKIKEIVSNPSQIIIVYCSTGHRGRKAQKQLQMLGYKQVYNLQNGLESYN